MSLLGKKSVIYLLIASLVILFTLLGLYAHKQRNEMVKEDDSAAADNGMVLEIKEDK